MEYNSGYTDIAGSPSLTKHLSKVPAAKSKLMEKLGKTQFEALTLLKVNLEILFLESNFVLEIKHKECILLIFSTF